ncbi:MAG: DUF6088 family protein [Acidimicrobiia bacterium]
METSAGTVAGHVRERVLRARPGTFLRRDDFEGSDRAVETALSRLAAAGELVRVRRGLYWRGQKTRFGMTRPSPLETALAIGGPGAGPAGVAAARLLGLTTQVPAMVEVAVAGKVPDPIPGVRFCSRPFTRRERRLRPLEVAVLELLRDPHAAEAPWPDVQSRVEKLMAERKVRPKLLAQEVAQEKHRPARERWSALSS